jgi:hypothetical protein
LLLVLILLLALRVHTEAGHDPWTQAVWSEATEPELQMLDPAALMTY